MLPRTLVPIQDKGNTKFRYVQRTIGGKKIWGIVWASCSDAVKKTNFNTQTAHRQPQDSPAVFGPGAQFGNPAQFGTLTFHSGNWHSYGINIVSKPSEADKPAFPEFNKPCGNK